MESICDLELLNKYILGSSYIVHKMHNLIHSNVSGVSIVGGSDNVQPTSSYRFEFPLETKIISSVDLLVRKLYVACILLLVLFICLYMVRVKLLLLLSTAFLKSIRGFYRSPSSHMDLTKSQFLIWSKDLLALSGIVLHLLLLQYSLLQSKTLTE